MIRIAEITLEAMPSAAIVGMTMLGEDEQPTTAIYTKPQPAPSMACRAPCRCPMISSEVAMGAMSLYAHFPDGFSDEEEAVGMDLAGAAGSVLSNVSAYWTAIDLSQNAERGHEASLDQQAKGMIMARSPGLTADEAFDVLRKASQRENVKPRLIAQRTVDRRPSTSGRPEGGTS